ncbi:MAG: asparagine synthase (glutamine-hydrolyzing) [Bacteroidetes bacterium]|nr:asparagine synthase (glutamine-hydrolyzing) [Bacteroidota bacterium]
MCGICGIIDTSQSLDPGKRDQWVQQMNEAIRHRGPDEAGYRSSASACLAMRRLAIIDLQSGQQPIYNPDRSISVFFNGEIYNFQEWRDTLEKEGDSFYTHSDTEVIVHLYQKFGMEGMLQRLKGMFALVIHDERDNTFYLARDRFGEKPLFYHQKEGKLFFSSEVKSLLEVPAIPRQLNEEALSYYLRLTMVPEPLTLLREVHSLKPGHYLKKEGNDWVQKAWFQPDYSGKEIIHSEAEAKEYIAPLLEKAVRRQMISDVPLGAFLSGGIDSSSIVALMQENSAEPIKTFTVRFEESTYDESPIARKVAQHLGTDHTEISIPNQDFSEDLFWKLIDHTGIPFPDSSTIPSYLITREIRSHVTVALSGDGGDELFGGYPIFQWWPKIARLQKTPTFLRQLAMTGVNLGRQIPRAASSSLLRKAGRALEAAQYEEEELGMAIQEMFSPADLKSLFGQPFQMPQPNLLANLPPAFAEWSEVRKAMYYRLTFNLPLDMLVKVDRMSMANSLEVRAPFLDPDLYEGSTRLADDLLIQNGKGKHLIREIMRDKLPEVVFNHPKTGFSIPLHQYQNAAFEKLAASLFQPKNPIYSLFDPSGLQAVVQNGLRQKSDTARQSVFRSSHQLWSLMQLFGWAQRFNVQVG